MPESSITSEFFDHGLPADTPRAVQHLLTTLKIALAVATLAATVQLTRASLKALNQHQHNSAAIDSIKCQLLSEFPHLRPGDSSEPILAPASRFQANQFPSLNAYEEQLLGDIILPSSIDVNFHSLGGLEHLKYELYESLVCPYQQFTKAVESMSAQQSAALHPSKIQLPRGILLYGPPGTGKTMIAKALANTLACCFLNISLATIQNKWFGESSKIVHALFSLARKVAPCIIFFDECETFMQRRESSGEHEASSQIRSDFLRLTDGIASNTKSQATEDYEPSSSYITSALSSIFKKKQISRNQITFANSAVRPPVILIACTNRPAQIDEAFLRRLPVKFSVPLPSHDDRAKILETFLEGYTLIDDMSKIVKPETDRALVINKLATRSVEYTGSDLKALCDHVFNAARIRASQHTDGFENTLESTMGISAPKKKGHKGVPAQIVIDPESTLYLSDFEQSMRIILRNSHTAIEEIREFELKFRS